MQKMNQQTKDKVNNKKKMKLMLNLAEGSLLEEQTEVKLALMKMEKVCVIKIACSNKHSLIVSLTKMARF